MKRWFRFILVLSALLVLLYLPTAVAETQLLLPDNLKVIKQEAFKGDTSVTSVIIPESVTNIGTRAFADCTGLKDVYIGNGTMQIAYDAFSGCSDVLFHVYPNSSGELFVLSHGYQKEYIGETGPAWERTMSMIGEAGFETSLFNSPQWETKRLVVRRDVNYLPDISAYSPIGIVQKSYDNIFVIQFSSPESTEACYNLLNADIHTVYVEEDLWHESSTVSGAGVVDAGAWSTDDPMGFDTYAPFVKHVGSGIVKIAIIDSGVKQNSHYNSLLIDGKNMLEDFDGLSWSADSKNHGSVIASIIKDCIGSNNIRIIPIRIEGAANQFDDALLAAGIDYAVDKGASIINLSMSCPRSSVVRDAINHATRMGRTVVVAAGNNARDVNDVFPANMSNVVTVSGISPNYRLSSWSNFGAVDYCAPDNYISTTAYSNSLKRYTSFAAPMISSALALVELDPYHNLTDMNSSCILTSEPSSFGKGLPQLQLMAKIDAKSIKIDTELPDVFEIGDSMDLSWTIMPVLASNQTVTATSSNDDVLTVTVENGVYTLNAVGQGQASIMLTVNDSDVSVTSKTIVVEQPVTNIAIAGAPSYLVVNHTVKLSAMVYPEDATNKAYTWQSGNSCASVDQNGVVTGLAEGTAVIYAIANDRYGAESNRLLFPVIIRPDAEAVDVYVNGNSVKGQTITIEAGQTQKLSFSVAPQEAEQIVEYESLNPSVVTIAPDGTFVAINPGATSILVMASTGRNIRATVNINVIVLPASVAISASDSTTINVGQTVQLSAALTPSNVSEQYRTITWSSNNQSVAEVNSQGLVTAKAPGTVNIIATTQNNKQASMTITVRHPYTITLDANGGQCGTASMVAYAGLPIGTLPTPTLSGCQFLGWYTERDSGTRVLSDAVYAQASPFTLYAHWESGWCLESEVPVGGHVFLTSWSYRESMESTNATESGWEPNGSRWQQTDTGSIEYATFPAGEYDTKNKYYKEMNVLPYTASETETFRRDVTNEQTGYIYWHWAYSAAYHSTLERIIAYKKGVYGDNNWGFIYFYAIKSTKVMPQSPSSYNTIGQYPKNGRTTYNCRTLISDTSVVPSADKTNSNSGLCTWRFYRLPYYTSTYTDFQKIYNHYRDLSYQSIDPGNGSNITNKVKYVKWTNNWMIIDRP